MAVFTPNLTSKLLLKSATNILKNQTGRVLELGCGSGWLTEKLIAEHGTNELGYWLSDISEEAIDVSKNKLIPPLTVENFAVGNCLEPWKNTKFDVIINDVAGISDGIAATSEWYRGVPFKAGIDGLANTREILLNISSFLNNGGVFIAPLISLSDINSYRAMLIDSFEEVVFEHQTFWPMPELKNGDQETVDYLRINGMIHLEEKYSKLLAFTEVCVCRNATKISEKSMESK